MQIRTSKFPFFFWGFNKAYECELDFKNQLYINKTANTKYYFKNFHFVSFLFLKYAPIAILLFLTFNRYDFNTDKNALLAYLFAFLMSLSINLLDNLARKICFIIIFIGSMVVGFFTNNYFLTAYALKYFLLISILILFYLDTRLRAFSLINNGKIISNFLIPRKLLKDLEK